MTNTDTAYVVIIDGHSANEQTSGWGLPGRYCRPCATLLVDAFNIAAELPDESLPLGWHAEPVRGPLVCAGPRCR